MAQFQLFSHKYDRTTFFMVLERKVQVWIKIAFELFNVRSSNTFGLFGEYQRFLHIKRKNWRMLLQLIYWFVNVFNYVILHPKQRCPRDIMEKSYYSYQTYDMSHIGQIIWWASEKWTEGRVSALVGPFVHLHQRRHGT